MKTFNHRVGIGSINYGIKSRCLSLLSLVKQILLALILFFITIPSRGQAKTYTTSGTFTVPAGITSIIVECYGAGGAGGGTASNYMNGGGGGAGGAYAKKTLTVVPGTNYTVTVGGVTTGTTSAGSNGAPSWFGTTGTVYAEGGAGGAAPNGGIAAGGTGSATSSIGDVVYPGGDGADGNSTLSGGGGGGAGSTGSGGNASGTTAGSGTSLNGGNGGTGRTNEGNGNPGSNYGGGGSGAYVPDFSDHSGGDGAAGLVVISYSFVTYTSSGSFTVPGGVTSVIVECWGAGGAGGGNPTTSDGGGGGGGGAYSRSTLAVTPGSNYTVTVGTGGTGSTGDGTNGGDSWFNTAGTILAKGGTGGHAPVFGNGGVGGNGGASGSCIGTFVYSGGNGGAGINNFIGRGGPGGSSAGTGANGTSGSTPWTTVTAGAAPAGGGIGGDGGTAGNNGASGSVPGGGGGGSGDGNRSGGAGADGQVIITWTPPVFYSQGSGDPNVLSNWKTSGGYSPTSFTANYQSFVIQNGHALTTTGSGWTVSGTSTLVEIQSGGTLTETTAISISSNTILQVDNGGTLNHNVNSVTVFGGVESFGNTSTVNYGFAGAQSVINATYGNLTLSGSGSKTIGTITVNGILSMEGTATASSTPTYGANATLQYKGSASQSTGAELTATFSGTGGVIVNNAAGLTLTASVTIGSILTMTQGNITTGSYTLILSNSTSANLVRSSGTIIGKFQRAIGVPTGTEYLYPVGTATSYNPLKITFTNLTAGQLAVQFQPNDIGVTGLPLNDAGTDIYDRHTTGYWTLTAIAPMASTNYSIILNYTGFTGVDALARIMKRINGGNLTLDGTHGTVSSPEISRTGLSGISTTTTDFAIGKPNPRIITQPSNFEGCNASFSVVATGKPTLTYQWQENNGGGFINITDGGIYSGATSNSLSISGASGSMNGYLYRCIVTDGLGYFTTSNNATLSVVMPVVTLGFNYSMDITLDPASGPDDLTDFPALISFTNSNIRTVTNGGHVENSNGYDIIFTDQNENKLDHQIESYNPATGQYIGWVRIPVLSHTVSTTIEMLYGDPTISSNPSVTSVWTSNYKGVWHLNGADYTDATINSNNGTNNATSNVTGKIAGGRGFNGTTSYIQVTTSGFVPNDNNQTISIWARYSSTPGGNRNLISFQNAGASSAIQLGFRGGNAVAWKWGGVILANAGAAPSTNTWHYYVYTYDGTNSRIYIDGIELDNSTVAPQTAMPSEGNMGRYNNGEYINANLDEPRFSISPKSAGWILTEYNNQNDPANFISLSSENAATILASLGVCSTTYTLDQGSPSGGSYSGTGVSGTNFNASVAGVGTHSITYLYTDINGCSNTAFKDIIVTPIPSAPVASDKECCILNVADLEATGTNLKWYSDAGLTILVGTGTPFATTQTAAGVYTYYVTQTVNLCESSAATASLIIHDGISINTQPQPLTICEDGDAIFTVDASGYNLTYQWQEDGSDITDGGIYSGATTDTLTLTNPGITKNGKLYRCIVSTVCGASPQNSNTALLTVTPLPVATFSYSGTPYCPNAADPLPTFSGGGVAGTFSSTAGLVFVSTSTGQVDLSASTPGDYIVTNTIAPTGGCGEVIATSPISILEGQTWTGAVDTDWNTAGNWSCGYIPGPSTPVVIQNVMNKPVLSTGAVGTTSNITIDPGSSLTVIGNKLQIAGSITNNGTFTANDGIIEMNGSVAQVIGASVFAGDVVKDLIINNASGVTLLGTLNITGIVTVQNGTLSSDGNLVLVSSASGTALIDGSGTGTVSGNVIMQRYLSSGFGYKYFSSPFQAATVNEFSDEVNLADPFPPVFKYDESRTSSGWVSYVIPANTLNALEGYAVNFGSSATPVTVDITGTVSNGNQSRTIYNNNNTYTLGFNLAGNPYPSPIDWDAASGWTKTNIDDALYYFKASGTDQYGGTYSTYISGVSSDGLATNIIPSSQGFFVHVTDGSYPVTGTLGTTNSVRVTDLTHIFLKSAAFTSSQLLRMKVCFMNDTLEADPMVVYFNWNATGDFDSKYDALKLYNTDLNFPNLYSFSDDHSKLSINALPFFTEEYISIPLGLKLNKAGDILFRLINIDNLIAAEGVHLVDVIAGTAVDMISDKEYAVNLSAGEYTDRFFLDIGTIQTSYQEIKEGEDLINIYSSYGIIKVIISRLPGGKGLLQVFDLTGRMLYTNQIYEEGYHEYTPGLANGIYIIRFKCGKEIVTKKIVIRNQ